MELPEIRPGAVHEGPAGPRVLAFFPNAAQGNSTIQMLTAMGVPNDKLGVTPPERIEGEQGMLLSIPCADELALVKIESLCRKNGAQIHRQRR